MITSVSGASAYFKGSVVTYSNTAKTDLLEIEEQLIAKHDVVSAEVATAMAANVQRLMQTDYALATTGNAGPTSEPGKAEVGVVFIALATPETVLVSEFNFGQPREKVIDRAATKSLEMLQQAVLKNRV